MYLRFVRLHLREGAEPAFRKFYTERVQPALAEMEGCLFAGLLAPWNSEEHRSLTLWSSPANAQAYEESGLYHQLLRECEPYLSNRTVWRVRLGDATQSGETVREIPPEGYEVAGGGAEQSLERAGRSLYVRIVSVQVASERRSEFEALYRGTILPAVAAFAGCRGAFLAASARDPNEMLSITVWDREENATRYEMSGEFERLTERARATFSPLRQWQLTLRDGDERQAAPDVSTYHLVAARRLAQP